MPTYNTLDEICNSFNIESRPEYIQYEKDIISLFNNGDIITEDSDLSETFAWGIMYHWCGMYHYHSRVDTDRAEEYFMLAIDAGCKYSFQELGLLYLAVNADEKAKLYFHKSLDTGCCNSKCVFALANICDAVDGEFDTAKIYYKRALDMGYWDAAICLADIYNQYDDNFDEALKYYMIAIEHDDEEAFIHLMNFIVDVDYEPADNEINIIIQFAKLHSEPVCKLFNGHRVTSNDLSPIPFSREWHDILVNLGLEKPDLVDMNYLALKRKNQSKLAKCDICMSDGELECAPVNWCMHYVCISCYKMVWDKACPFCRLESLPAN